MAQPFNFSLKSCDIDEKKAMQKFGLEAGGRVQQIIDSEVLRLMEPYIPFDTGNMRDNGIANTEIGSGKIDYIGTYFRKQYYIPMPHDGKRCAYWFEVMKADGGKERILGAAQKTAGGK